MRIIMSILLILILALKFRPEYADKNSVTFVSQNETGTNIAVSQSETYQYRTSQFGACIKMGQVFLVCNRCDKMKEQFFMDEKFSFLNGNKNVCKDCVSIAKHLETKRKFRKDSKTKPLRMFKNYWPGISAKEASIRYRQMLKTANNQCEICGAKQTKPRLNIDHCHSTGIVRGVLCSPCNFALGSFKDDVKTLLKAIEYLETKRHVF